MPQRTRFGNHPLLIFTAAGLGEYESAVRTYGSSSTRSSMTRTPSTSGTSAAVSSVNIVYFGRAGPLEATESNNMEALREEGSTINKRAPVRELLNVARESRGVETCSLFVTGIDLCIP